MNPFRTEHIEVNPHDCEACGRCVEACREDALCIVGLLFHKHVKVRDADRCRGCLRCVKACEHGAIRATMRRMRSDPGGAA
jgi:ferredoxin